LQDEAEDTPAHKAARCGHVACLEFLQSMGAESGLPNSEGRTPGDLFNDVGG
jgi:ankyrin repeat protein